MRHRLMDALRHLVHVEIGDRTVQGRCADEGVDARPFRVLHRLPAAVDILDLRAGEAADDGVPGGFRDV